MSRTGWIGVDLDGTLAHYDGWKGPEHIGSPIILMADKVRKWLQEGQEVRIFTARAGDNPTVSIPFIETWCQIHLGQVLPVTNIKDFGMIELYDDRAFRVGFNTGEIL